MVRYCTQEPFPVQISKNLKVEFEVEENIQTIVNMLKDVSNMHLWYDKIKIAKTLKGDQ